MTWRERIIDLLVVAALCAAFILCSGTLLFKGFELEPLRKKIAVSSTDSEREGWELVRMNKIYFPYSILLE